jgi:hypothetical protein
MGARENKESTYWENTDVEKDPSLFSIEKIEISEVWISGKSIGEFQ